MGMQNSLTGCWNKRVDWFVFSLITDARHHALSFCVTSRLLLKVICSALGTTDMNVKHVEIVFWNVDSKKILSFFF